MSYGPQPWLQQHWDLRAAANFALGGTGAGLVLASALAMPAPRYALALGLTLIACGLGAVWLEIGRKLRVLHVFLNPKTSWMARESLAALVLFALGVATLVRSEPWLLGATALAALAFVYCQARILRASKGIPAWRAPEAVPLLVTSALGEGAAAALFFETVPLALPLLGAAVIARAIAEYRYWSAVKRLRCASALERPRQALWALGTVAPLVLILGIEVIPFAALLAAATVIGTGWWFKFVLVTRAAFNQGFALPHLPVRGAR